MTMAAVRFLVSGKVQGVWFRASARDQALALGLRGSARNLSSGAVDVLAVGDAAAIDLLAAWLRQGPPLARVDELERLPAHDDDASTDGFEIG